MSICKTSDVQQVVILRNQVRPVPNAVKFAPLTGIGSTGTYFAKRFQDSVIWKKKVRVQKTLELTETFWRANDNLTIVVSVRKSKNLRRTAKGALVVSSGIAEVGGASVGMFVVDVDESVDGQLQRKGRAERSFCQNWRRDRF